jgi:hypothetical protein
MGLKQGAIGNTLGEHIGKIGNILGTYWGQRKSEKKSSPPPTQNLKEKK